MKQFLVFALILSSSIQHAFSQSSSESTPVPTSIPVPPAAKPSPKGILTLGFNLGISYDKINTGIVAIPTSTTGAQNPRDVLVGPGGGYGLEIGIGGRIAKKTNLVVHAGVQRSYGIPDIEESNIRFSRAFIRPEIHYALPINTDFGFELGLGAYVGFAQNLKIKAPSSVNFQEENIRYKTNVGVVNHIYFTDQIENIQGFGGMRFHWVNLEVDKYLKGGQVYPSNPELEKRFDNRNGGGVTFVIGFRFLI